MGTGKFGIADGSQPQPQAADAGFFFFLRETSGSVHCMKSLTCPSASKCIGSMVWAEKGCSRFI